MIYFISWYSMHQLAQLIQIQALVLKQNTKHICYIYYYKVHKNTLWMVYNTVCLDACTARNVHWQLARSYNIIAINTIPTHIAKQRIWCSAAINNWKIRKVYLYMYGLQYKIYLLNICVIFVPMLHLCSWNTIHHLASNHT